MPVVVKGVCGDGGGTEVRFADTEAAVPAAVHELTAQTGKRPFLQQFVSGPSFFAGGLFVDGRAVRLHVCEMVETFPPRTGPSVRQRTTHDVADLVGQFLSLMGALRWTGLAQGDFIRAPDGSFLFLEINPRPWGSIAAARFAGVDLFAPLAEILRGGTPAPDLRYKEGVDTVLFPQRLISELSGGGYRPRAYARAATDLRLWRAVPWKRPRLVWQLTRWMAYRFRDRRNREQVARSDRTAA
jgi:predicted ATP-grasp superfamily ATP-dependent carboligase